MKNSQEAILAEWDEVLEVVAATQEDFPHIDDYRTQLAANAETLRILQSRRALLRHEIQQKTLEIQAVLTRGKDLLIRIQDGARSRYGIYSDKLSDFGIKPHRKRKRRLRKVAPEAGVDRAAGAL